MREVIVIGGRGRLGACIMQALQTSGQPTSVRAMSRSARPPADVRGTITDADAVAGAVRLADVVIVCVESDDDGSGPNSPRRVHRDGIANVVAGLRQARRTGHVVLISQIYITRAAQHPDMRAVIAARAEGEQLLRASGIPYTIIRPSWLTDGPANVTHVALAQGDDGDGQVSRRTVGQVVAAALDVAEARGRTFELYERADDQGSIEDQLRALRSDPAPDNPDT